MTPTDEWVDPLKRLIRDHKETLEFVEYLEQVMRILQEKDSWEKLKSIEIFFNRHILEHFAFEETVIFPAVLSGIASPESRELIPELQSEHQSILKELEAVQTLASGSSPLSPDSDMDKGLYAVVRQIMDSLLRHASKEDDRLLPIIEKNRHLFNRKDVL